jgi:cell division protein FtsB
VDPDLVVHDKEHGIYTVRYEAVNAMLLNEFLKEHRTVENENKEIEQLQQTVAELKDMVSKLAENQKATEQK